MSGRMAPKNVPTTFLPRLAAVTKQALSAWWKTQVQNVRLPTRADVSSDWSTLLDSRWRLMAFAWVSNAGALSCRMLASAPSLISSPNRSESSRASRSNGIAYAKRR